MDPGVGRFVSVDPYDGDPQAPVSLHRYLYAAASPVNFVDPNGESYISATGTLGINSILFTVGRVVTSTAAQSFGQVVVEAAATVALAYATNEILRDVIQFAPADAAVAGIIGVGIMAREFNEFRKSDEFRRESRKKPNATHYVGVWGPSGSNTPNADKSFGSLSVSKIRITHFLNGGSGRLFQFRYQIGKNAGPGQGYFNFRADYLDYTADPPFFNPHYHLRWGNKNLNHVPFFK
jgi:hypothetical protein